MPRINIDYSKTIIYKLVCNDLNINDLYVGSTTDFTERKYRHKYNSSSTSNKECHLKVYKFIRQNGGWANWSMIEVEKYPCKDGNEKRARERYWIETLNATLNCLSPFQTKEEQKQLKKELDKIYRSQHKEEMKEYNINYRLDNKERIKESQTRQYNCECGKILQYSNKARHLNSDKHINFVYKNNKNDEKII